MPWPGRPDATAAHRSVISARNNVLSAGGRTPVWCWPARADGTGTTTGQAGRSGLADAAGSDPDGAAAMLAVDAGDAGPVALAASWPAAWPQPAASTAT